MKDHNLRPDALIYKVVTRRQWDEAITAGRFTGAAIDLADGYIHFSTAAQLVETVRKHFHGQQNLVIVSVDVQRLGPNLKWEPSRGGDLFPHLYDALQVTATKAVFDLSLGENGEPCFPPGPWNTV